MSDVAAKMPKPQIKVVQATPLDTLRWDPDNECWVLEGATGVKMQSKWIILHERATISYVVE